MFCAKWPYLLSLLTNLDNSKIIVQVHYVRSCTLSLHHHLFVLSSLDAKLDPITFQLTSDVAAQIVTFSMTCTSNGGPISTMEWDRDGVAIPGSSIYPDLTDNVTATYTNILRVSGREIGDYRCNVTDGAGTISLLQNLTVQGRVKVLYKTRVATPLCTHLRCWS